MRRNTVLMALACGLMLVLTAAAEAQVQFSVGNPYTGQAMTFGSNGAGRFYATPGYAGTTYGTYGNTGYGANTGYTYPYYGTNAYNYGTGYPSYGANTTRYYSSGYSGYTGYANPGYTGYASPRYSGYVSPGYSNYYSSPSRYSYGTASPYGGYSSYGTMRTYAPYGYNYGWRR